MLIQDVMQGTRKAIERAGEAELWPKTEEEGRFMTRNTAIQGTAEGAEFRRFKIVIEELMQRRNGAIQGNAEGTEFWRLKMAHDDADSVDGIIITLDDPAPKRRARDDHEMKTIKLKKKKGKRVPKPFPITDVIIPVEFPQPEDEGRFMRRRMAIENAGKVELPQLEEAGRFMKRKRPVEETAEEAGFRDAERAHNDADAVDDVILTSDDPPSKRSKLEGKKAERVLKEKKAKGIQKDLPDPPCNSEPGNCENPVVGSVHSTACNLSELLCAVTGSRSQNNVVSTVLVSFLEDILKLHQSEASTSTHLDNVLSQASQVIMKNVIVLVQLLQMNPREEIEKLKYENKNLKDEKKNLQDEKKNLQRGIEAVLSVIHLK